MIIEIAIILSVYIIGIATGLYAASQIEDHIEPKQKETYPDFAKKHYKK